MQIIIIYFIQEWLSNKITQYYHSLFITRINEEHIDEYEHVHKQVSHVCTYYQYEVSTHGEYESTVIIKINRAQTEECNSL